MIQGATWWQALRADPLPWLLDDARPAVQWRTLVELVGRPAASAAVARVRGAASAAEPVASVLEPLHPDGAWALEAAPWAPGGGAWRLIAAAQLGADPADPRLAAAGVRLLDGAADGGFGEPVRPCSTARLAAALLRLGFAAQPRLVEALAWLEVQPAAAGGGWACPEPGHATAGGCVVTGVALLGAPADAVERRGLADRAAEAVLAALAGGWTGHRVRLPRLAHGDAVEVLWALARSRRDYDERMRPALQWLQSGQDPDARWTPDEGPPLELGLPPGWGAAGEPSPDLTLDAAVALAAYATAADLPRLYPPPPGR